MSCRCRHTSTTLPGTGSVIRRFTAGLKAALAAPTAGLHFTPELLKRLRGMGVGWETITLHAGLDTFGPVTAERVADHQIHREWAQLTAESANVINAARVQGGRILAVGTTSTRVLEFSATAAQDVDGYGPEGGRKAVVPFVGEVDLFIYPGYRFMGGGRAAGRTFICPVHRC